MVCLKLQLEKILHILSFRDIDHVKYLYDVTELMVGHGSSDFPMTHWSFYRLSIHKVLGFLMIE